MATKNVDSGTDIEVRGSGQSIDISRGYTSVRGTDIETQKKFYNAMSNALSLADHLGTPIKVKDIIVRPVVSEPDEKGAVDEYLRTTFISPDGTAIATGSKGVATAVENMFAIFGTPDNWGPDGLTIVVNEKRGNNGYKFYSVEVI